MVKDDLFKNPFKTELYEFVVEFNQQEEDPSQGRASGYGFSGVGRARRNGQQVIHRRPKSIMNNADRTIWANDLDHAREIAAQHGIPPHLVRPRTKINWNSKGNGPLEEVRIRDYSGKMVDTDIGGYHHPETGDWVPHKPASGGWTRHDSGIRPSRSPVNKSQWPKASTILDPQNAEIFRRKEEALRKKDEAKELRKIEMEQRNALRARRLAKQEQELDNPTPPKPRGRPPKRTGWF